MCTENFMQVETFQLRRWSGLHCSSDSGLLCEQQVCWFLQVPVIWHSVLNSSLTCILRGRPQKPYLSAWAKTRATPRTSAAQVTKYIAPIILWESWMVLWIGWSYWSGWKEEAALQPAFPAALRWTPLGCTVWQCGHGVRVSFEVFLIRV